MDNKRLIGKLAALVESVPDQAEVIALRQYSLEEIEQRAKRFLLTTVEAFICRETVATGSYTRGRRGVTYP